MPELPEVEVVCRLIKPHLIGRTFENIEKFTDKLRYPVKVDQYPELLDSRISDVRRYGRYIAIELNNLSGLILHLGMTGQMKIVDNNTPRQAHDHLAFSLSSGCDLRFNCVRKFGFVEYCRFDAKDGEPDGLPVLGPDPLSNLFTAEYLFGRTQSRRMPVKSLLMDNAVVPGIGNIYSSEVLFEAGIHPQTPANHLSLAHISPIVSSVKKVLSQSVEAGMAFNDGIDAPQGTEWKYPVDFAVYARNGELCRRCPGVVSQLKLSGRSCFYCPQCQMTT